ncbi:MAG: hypothetical protein R2748_21295 [Bryobacterales bacterium]
MKYATKAEPCRTTVTGRPNPARPLAQAGFHARPEPLHAGVDVTASFCQRFDRGDRRRH